MIAVILRLQARSLKSSNLQAVLLHDTWDERALIDL